MKNQEAKKLFGAIKSGLKPEIKIENGHSNLYVGNQLIEKNIDYMIQDNYTTYIDESGAEYLCPENYVESRVKGDYITIYSDGNCRAWGADKSK